MKSLINLSKQIDFNIVIKERRWVIPEDKLKKLIDAAIESTSVDYLDNLSPIKKVMQIKIAI